MVKIFVEKGMAYIKSPRKHLTKKKDAGQTVNDFVFDVVSKCNDKDITLVTWFDEYNNLVKNPDQNPALAKVLIDKEVKFETFTDREWREFERAMVMAGIAVKPPKKPSKPPKSDDVKKPKEDIKKPADTPTAPPGEGDDPFA